MKLWVTSPACLMNFQKERESTIPYSLISKMNYRDAIIDYRKYAKHERCITFKATKEIIACVVDFFEKQKLKTLKSATTQVIRNYLLESKELKHWRQRTLRNKRQYLRSFFEFCIRYNYLKVNPVDQISKPKIPKSQPRYLKSDEVNKILLHLDTMKWSSRLEQLRNQCIVRTFLLTGIRLNELRCLKSSEVSFIDCSIKIKNGKGGKDRSIPIHPSLFPYLKAYQREKSAPTSFFFSSVKSDSQLTKKNIYAVLKKIKAKSGVKFTPHMFRHTMGKRAIEANLNPFVLQKILGHSSISTTQIYVEVSDKSTSEAFSKIDLL